MVKVAVLGSARAPLAVITAPTADRAMVMPAMVTSRLPIEPPLLGPDAGVRLLSGQPPSRRPGSRPARRVGSCTATSDGDTTAWAATSRDRHCFGPGQPTLATWPRLGLVDGDGHAVAARHIR